MCCESFVARVKSEDVIHNNSGGQGTLDDEPPEVREILDTLDNFDKDQPGSTKQSLKQKKYKCAGNLITKFSKKNLETAKAEIESQIENDRTFAALVAAVGVVVVIAFTWTWKIPDWMLILIKTPEKWKLSLEVITKILFVSIPTIFFIFKVGRKSVYQLHILKIALARKSDA